MDGKDLPVMTKLHAHKFKRVFPTMAGIIGVIVVTLVTYVCNWERGQTWLPLAGFVGGGIVGFIDDLIKVKNKQNEGLKPYQKIFFNISKYARYCSLISSLSFSQSSSNTVLNCS